MADRWIRALPGVVSQTVMSANSLQGAAISQGLMFVVRLREQFGPVPITETHPKALLQATGMCEARFVTQYSVSSDHSNQHEFDAVVSAVAAREGFEDRWTFDLTERRNRSEQDPADFWLAPVHYFWPEI